MGVLFAIAVGVVLSLSIGFLVASMGGSQLSFQEWFELAPNEVLSWAAAGGAGSACAVILYRHATK